MDPDLIHLISLMFSMYGQSPYVIIQRPERPKHDPKDLKVVTVVTVRQKCSLFLSIRTSRDELQAIRTTRDELQAIRTIRRIRLVVLVFLPTDKYRSDIYRLTFTDPDFY